MSQDGQKSKMEKILPSHVYLNYKMSRVSSRLMTIHLTVDRVPGRMRVQGEESGVGPALLRPK